MHSLIHTRTTWQKDENWQKILFDRFIRLASNWPTELLFGQFDASPIGFLNRKFNLFTNWGGYKGKISTPTGQYTIQMVYFSVAGSVLGLQCHSRRL
jgi:hypothetical protein